MWYSPSPPWVCLNVRVFCCANALAAATAAIATEAGVCKPSSHGDPLRTPPLAVMPDRVICMWKDARHGRAHFISTRHIQLGRELDHGAGRGKELLLDAVRLAVR